MSEDTTPTTAKIIEFPELGSEKRPKTVDLVCRPARLACHSGETLYEEERVLEIRFYVQLTEEEMKDYEMLGLRLRWDISKEIVRLLGDIE